MCLLASSRRPSLLTRRMLAAVSALAAGLALAAGVPATGAAAAPTDGAVVGSQLDGSRLLVGLPL